jgi:hypothetical protein
MTVALSFFLCLPALRPVLGVACSSFQALRETLSNVLLGCLLPQLEACFHESMNNFVWCMCTAAWRLR